MMNPQFQVFNTHHTPTSDILGGFLHLTKNWAWSHKCWWILRVSQHIPTNFLCWIVTLSTLLAQMRWCTAAFPPFTSLDCVTTTFGRVRVPILIIFHIDISVSVYKIGSGVKRLVVLRISYQIPRTVGARIVMNPQFKVSTLLAQLRDALVSFRLSPFTSFKCMTKDNWRGRSDIASISPRHPQISITWFEPINHCDHKNTEFDNTILLQTRWGPLARVNLCSKSRNTCFAPSSYFQIPHNFTINLHISPDFPASFVVRDGWKVAM